MLGLGSNKPASERLSLLWCLNEMIKTCGQLCLKYSSKSISMFVQNLNAIFESEVESVSVLLEHSIRIFNDLGLIEYTCNITDSIRNK